MEENNEILQQQLRQLQELQTSQKQIIDTLNERVLVLENKNNQATSDLIIANDTIQKLRTEKEIEIRKVINIAKKLDDVIHTKMNSEEELEETQARVRELESELTLSRTGSIDSLSFGGLVLSRSDFSVSEKYENMSEISSPSRARGAAHIDEPQQRLDDVALIKELQGEIDALKKELSNCKDVNSNKSAESPFVKLQITEILQQTPKDAAAAVAMDEPREMYDWSREELIFELIEQKIKYALTSFELEDKTGKLHSLLKRIKKQKSKS